MHHQATSFQNELRTEESSDPRLHHPPAFPCRTGIERNPKAGDVEEPEPLCAWTLAPEVARAGSTLPSEILRLVKMLLDLSEEHKEHLAFLPQVDSTGQGARQRRVVFCGLGVKGCARRSWSPGFRCSGRGVWADCGGVPEARLEPQDLRRRRQ